MKAFIFRKHNHIRIFSSNTTFIDKVFPSITQAKRESRTLQIANGGLGNGALAVTTKIPARISVFSEPAQASTNEEEKNNG